MPVIRTPLLVLLWGALLLATARAGDLVPYESLRVKGFKFRGDRFVITGREALVSGGTIDVRQGRAELSPEDDTERLILFAPRFTFNRATNRGVGDDRIHLRRRNLTIDGRDFTVDFTGRRVIIRRDVRVKIFAGEVNLLGN